MSDTLGILREKLVGLEQRTVTSVLRFGVAALDDRLFQGGLAVNALHEVAAAREEWGGDAAALLFLAGIAARHPGPVLWVGRRWDLFAPALQQAGLRADCLIHVGARDDAELLAVMEDALRYGGLSAVVGEVRKAGLVATRRLQLAAEGGSTLALLLRRPARFGEDPLATASAAMTRWRIGSVPSAPLPVVGIGRARWQVELVRQRGGAPFMELLEACDEKGRCAVATKLADRSDHEGRADARAAT